MRTIDAHDFRRLRHDQRDAHACAALARNFEQTLRANAWVRGRTNSARILAVVPSAQTLAHWIERHQRAVARAINAGTTSTVQTIVQCPEARGEDYSQTVVLATTTQDGQEMNDAMVWLTAINGLLIPARGITSPDDAPSYAFTAIGDRVHAAIDAQDDGPHWPSGWVNAELAARHLTRQEKYLRSLTPGFRENNPPQDPPQLPARIINGSHLGRTRYLIALDTPDGAQYFGRRMAPVGFDRSAASLGRWFHHATLGRWPEPTLRGQTYAHSHATWSLPRSLQIAPQGLTRRQPMPEAL